VKYYPVFLNLSNKRAVVAGGGKVAERKVRVLIRAGASVKVVSPHITKYLERLAKDGRIHHVKRSYRKGDLKDAFLVIAGTSSASTNEKIARDARHLVNVGNFIAPSIVRRGVLTIAISTGGSSPAVAKTIRKELEKLYGSEFSHYLRLLEKVRRKIMREIQDGKEREKLLKKVKGKAPEKGCLRRDLQYNQKGGALLSSRTLLPVRFLPH
jgi:precorrin-2 dehydrogenase/sirohydrochlorin ferrochelatase